MRKICLDRLEEETVVQPRASPLRGTMTNPRIPLEKMEEQDFY